MYVCCSKIACVYLSSIYQMARDIFLLTESASPKGIRRTSRVEVNPKKGFRGGDKALMAAFANIRTAKVMRSQVFSLYDPKNPSAGISSRTRETKNETTGP